MKTEKPSFVCDKYNRKSVFSDDLKNYCYLSGNNDFIEVTEWKNGEGFDVVIESHSHGDIFALTYGQFKLLKKLVKELSKLDGSKVDKSYQPF